MKSEYVDSKKMTTWFYYDKDGQKQGPISGGKLKGLAKVGLISPETLVEAESGKTVPAQKIQGLKFQDASAAPSEGMDSGILESLSLPSPIPVPIIQDFGPESDIYTLSADFSDAFQTPEQEVDDSTNTHDAEEIPPPPFPNHGNEEHNFLPLSRTVFIFLAVFVGIFGVHDFYAKRARHGRIHLWLLSPWILVGSISILAVFGWTLYAWTYSPLHKEIGECEQTIKDCEKEIAETEQKLKDALEGKLRKPRRQPDVVRVEPERRVDPPAQIEAQKRFEVDWELVEELRDILQDLHSRLDVLHDRLANLKLDRKFMQIDAWTPVGPLWLYFFFIVLPLISWVMAMVEIIYVTRDGTGREFGY